MTLRRDYLNNRWPDFLSRQGHFGYEMALSLSPGAHARCPLGLTVASGPFAEISYSKDYA